MASRESSAGGVVDGCGVRRTVGKGDGVPSTGVGGGVRVGAEANARPEAAPPTAPLCTSAGTARARASAIAAGVRARFRVVGKPPRPGRIEGPTGDELRSPEGTGGGSP